MPSGYTEKLYNGEQDFKDFVLRTARGMGALIHMRDTGLDAEITLPEVSDYHSKRLDEARAELKKYESYTDEQWEAERDDRYDEDFKRWWEVEEKKNARTARYNAMLEKVRDWTPPSKDHENFKQYMIDQLEDSKNFDCVSLRRPVLLSVEEFKKGTIDRVVRDINYHAEKMVEEHERVEERRRWIQQLLDSLPDE